MTLTRCPNCDAQVLPGDVACRKCRFDFIMGRQLSASPEEDERRRLIILRATVFGGLALFLVAIGFTLMLASRPAGPAAIDSHPCLDALASLHPLVVGAHSRGNPLPTCGPTPPGPVSCWEDADVSAIPGADGLTLTISPTRSGFEIQCRADLDSDGVSALFEANREVPGLRISAPGVR